MTAACLCGPQEPQGSEGQRWYLLLNRHGDLLDASSFDQRPAGDAKIVEVVPASLLAACEYRLETHRLEAVDLHEQMKKALAACEEALRVAEERAAYERACNETATGLYENWVKIAKSAEAKLGEERCGKCGDPRSAEQHGTPIDGPFDHSFTPAPPAVEAGGGHDLCAEHYSPTCSDCDADASALAACEEKLRVAEASEAEAIAHWTDTQTKLDNCRTDLRKAEETIKDLARNANDADDELDKSEARLEKATALLNRIEDANFDWLGYGELLADLYAFLKESS